MIPYSFQASNDYYSLSQQINQGHPILLEVEILIFSQNTLMALLSKYEGKRVLMTGVTGFVGKVLLQKFLYSLSSVEKIYVLIRVKEGTNLQERFVNEIVNSPCFNRLRTLHKLKFDDFIQSKVQVIEGDLLEPELGLSKQIQEELIEKCNVIINCAASIDFNARLDQSMESNIWGPLKILNLAKRIKDLDVFTHISTSYANSDRRGLVKEEIYEKDTDPEEQLRYLHSLTLNQLVEKTKSIVGNFPNTYTFTKNLCERLLKKKRGDLPICIIRPSIINTSYIQPFPGWIDNIAAAAALYMMVGLGIVHEVRGDEKKLVDTVPVDYVVSTIIVATAFNMKKPKLSIYHSAITDRNPFVMGKIKDLVVKYWNENVVKNKFEKASLCYSVNEWKIRISKMKRLPVQLYCRLGPLLGSQHKKNANKIKKTIDIGQKVASIFEYFLRNEWIFECKNYYELQRFLSVEDRKQFPIDVTSIDFVRYIELNNYGIQYYVLKENAQIPINNINMLTYDRTSAYFPDLKWACNHQPIQSQYNRYQIKNRIRNSKQIQQAINKEIQKRMQTYNGKQSALTTQVITEVDGMIHSIVGDIRNPSIKTGAWGLHKIFKKIYERINVNSQVLQELRQTINNAQIPIVLIPTRRSLFDFLILTYIFFSAKLRLPILIHDQGVTKSAILSYFIKKFGSIFFDKVKYTKSKLYKAIFDLNIKYLLAEGNILQFFIQGPHPSCGRITKPQLDILNILADTLLQNAVPEICIVPITINYQKIFQDSHISTELFGKKTQDSLYEAASKLRQNFGKVYVQMCKPIMCQQLVSTNNEPRDFSKQSISQVLSKEIIHRMIDETIIVGTSIVSSVLLLFKKGVDKDLLSKSVTEILKHVLKKGHKIGGINEHSPTIAIQNSLNFLGKLITKSNNIYSLSNGRGKSPQKLLIVGQYRNNLIQVFLPQVFIGCVLLSFRDSTNIQDITLTKVYQKTKFLMLLLSEEYHIKNPLSSFSEFIHCIQHMQDSEILEVTQQKIAVSKSGVTMIPFYSSLIRPQIQTYWSSLVYILSIVRYQVKHEASSLDHFFDTVQWSIKTLYEENVIQEYEACSKNVIRSAFEKFKKEKLIKMEGGSKKKKATVQILASIDQLQMLQSNIKFFLQKSSEFSPLEIAKTSMKELAKL